jgi:hypothetical protein
MAELLEVWAKRVGATDRVPAGWEAVMDRDPHAELLRQAGFEYLGRFEFPVLQTWTVTALVGFVYSTSWLNRGVLGTHATTFEQEIRELLFSREPEGAFREPATFAYELAQKPL